MKAFGGSRIRAAFTALWLVACVLLGGASAAGAFANAMLQAGAVAIILLLLWRGRLHIPHEARLLAWIVALYLLWVLASLVPLPLSTWRGLPYRGEFAEGLELLGIESGSLAASLAPSATITSLLALLPPMASFLLVTSLPAERRGTVLGTLVAIATASIALGVFQLLGGPASPLRFYEITNEMSAVGFFANVNHNATLALCALPCVAAMAARFVGRRDRSQRSGGLLIAISSAAFLVIGIGLMGSTAGYGLVFPALAASAFIYRRAIVAKIGMWWRVGLAALAIIFVAIAVTGPLSQERLSAKFSDYPTSRRVIAETTIRAAEAGFPLGTGLGTYSDVYRRFQDPAAASQEYVNHAHDDYLEVALELGVPGLLLVLAFILWWLRRSVATWREDSPYVAAARAGSVIVGLVLLHSLVDYPIRTAAIAAVFATGCALIVPARPARRDGSSTPESGRARHLKVE